jgi:hypothetical protein
MYDYTAFGFPVPDCPFPWGAHFEIETATPCLVDFGNGFFDMWVSGVG